MVLIDSEICPLYGLMMYLPDVFASSLQLFCLKSGDLASTVTEVRLRCGGAFSLSCGNENIFIDTNGNVTKKPVICTEEDIRTCVFLLCENSYHTHEEEIKHGYISMKNGFRAGIAPKSAHTSSVFGISSVNIRVPREVVGVSDPLTSVTKTRSVLIYSPPGVGKTTVLKDLVRYICKKNLRCTVIDSRWELNVKNAPLADYITGTTKSYGIEIAARTLCPQFIVCDEIGSDDADGIIEVSNTGVPFAATCHGGSFEEIMRRPFVKRLYDAGVFDFYARLFRNGSETSFDITECV